MMTSASKERHVAVVELNRIITDAELAMDRQKGRVEIEVDLLSRCAGPLVTAAFLGRLAKQYQVAHEEDLVEGWTKPYGDDDEGDPGEPGEFA